MVTVAQVKNLHKKYSKGAYSQIFFEIVWTHSLIIREIVLQIATDLEKSKGIKVNKKQLEIGALVHDIGVYECFNEDLNPDKKVPQYIAHGYLGQELLFREGYPSSITRFASVHTGTGLTVEDIKKQNLALPKKDFIPISLEEEIVTFADKFHTKYPAFSTFEEQKSKLEKFDPAKGIKMEELRKKFGIPDLSNLKKKYAKWHIEKQSFYTSLNKTM